MALYENIDEFTEALLALAGLKVCREPWRIYYDETENCHSIVYKNETIADRRAIDRAFILGGIAILDEKAENKLAARVEPLIPQNGKMKAKTVLGGSDDFTKVLRRSVFCQ